MPQPTAPPWAKTQAERVETKAAHLAALYLLQRDGELPSVPKTQLADALGISRWTLDRYLASLPEVATVMSRVRSVTASQT